MDQIRSSLFRFFPIYLYGYHVMVVFVFLRGGKDWKRQ